MSNESAEPPWMSAWRAAQAELARFAGGDAAVDPTLRTIGRMLDVGSDYSALGANLWQHAVASGASRPAAAAGAELARHYPHLFMLNTGFQPAMPAPAEAMPARWQRALEAVSRHVQAIAADAGRRLADALAESGPAATPITTLRELFELWVDCGEAAWAAAALREDFVEAQAEWLAALVELKRDSPAR